MALATLWAPLVKVRKKLAAGFKELAVSLFFFVFFVKAYQAICIFLKLLPSFGHI